MFLMLQQPQPGDCVIASGEQHSVSEFVVRAFAEVGIEIEFSGEGVDEIGLATKVGRDRLRERCGILAEGNTAVEPGDAVVRIDPRYFRPTEVETLLGDPSLAREVLGWSAEIGFETLMSEMVGKDLLQAQCDGVLRAEGFDVRERRE
jgi:GDPmannose 4,6-dehydratase